MSSALRMRPQVKVFAGSKTVAATKTDLTASYVDVNSAIDVHGMSNPTLFLEEIANVENAVVNVFLSPDVAQPTVSTVLHQLVDAAGAEIEITIVKNTTQCYGIQAAAHWMMIQGKGAVGTSADLRAFLSGNFGQDGRGLRLRIAKIVVNSVAQALTGSEVIIGSPINIRGLSDLTMFVQNTDGSVTGTIHPYVSWGASQPAGISVMYSQDVVAGTAKSYDTLASEYAAHPLLGVSGDWLALAGSGNGADLIVSVMGNVAGFDAR